MKDISKSEALKLITENKPVFNVQTGHWYYYTYGTSTVAVFPSWIGELPEEGWRTAINE